MDTCPFGSALFCRWATRVKFFRPEEISKNPRLPVNRGFFVETERRPAGGQNESKDMNTTDRKWPTRFGPETRFDVRPPPGAPFRATEENELERLKNRLLRRELNKVAELELTAGVRRAANEAAALAWVTAVPLLVFPALFEEKARTAFEQAARQEVIRERSRELLAA